MKKYSIFKTQFILIIFAFLLQTSVCFAFEDYLIITEGKLTDISIENHDIIDVYPFITIMNERNTLVVSPQKVGKTRFCVLKNGKEKILFNVNVEQEKTIIDEVKGFDILPIDVPPVLEEFELDLPPMMGKGDSK